MKIFVGNDKDLNSIPRILRLEHKRGIVDRMLQHQRNSSQTPEHLSVSWSQTILGKVSDHQAGGSTTDTLRQWSSQH